MKSVNDFYMKKIIFYFSVSVLSLMPYLVSAISATDLQKQIEALQNQINALSGRTIYPTGAAVSPGTDEDAPFRFENDLIYRNKNNDPDEVRELQEFLTEQGFYKGQISGFFGAQTRTAVRKFQQANNFFVNGRFAGLTRERANEILDLRETTDGVTVKPAPRPADDRYIKIVAPVGGEKVAMGSNYTVRWDYFGVGSVSVYLTYPDGGLCLLGNVPASKRSYVFRPDEDYLCPSIPRKISAGSYKMYLYAEDRAGVVKAESDSFSIVSSDYNFTQKPRVEIGTVYGERMSWTVGQLATLRWTGTNLSQANKVSVYLSRTSWGNDIDDILLLKDINVNNNSLSFVAPNDPKIVTANDYVVAFVDSYWQNIGQSDKFSVISATSSSPTITLTSPNGGEQIPKGPSNYLIEYKINNYDKLTSPTLSFDIIQNGTLLGSRCGPSLKCVVYSGSEWWNFSWAPGTYETASGEYKGVETGSGFKIRANLYDNGRLISQDESDSTFNIVASYSSGTTPIIKLVTPFNNSGASFFKGSTYDIRWCGEGNFSPGYGQAALLKKGTPVIKYIGGSSRSGITYCSNGGADVFSWTIPTDLVSGSDYKIQVDFMDKSGGWVASGYSDGIFSILDSVGNQTPQSLSIGLDAATPGSANIYPGQKEVAFAKVRLSASGGDITINTVEVAGYASGNIGAFDTFSNIKVYDGGILLGSTGSLKRWYDGIEGRRSVPVSLTIASGNSKIITFVSDITSNASGYLQLGVTGFSYTGGSPGATGLPVYGVHMAVKNPSVSNGPTTGYVFCADEGGNCGFTGAKSVAYGANNKFNYQIFTGGTACNNGIFGDPIPYTIKACYIKDVVNFTMGDVNGDGYINSSDATLILQYVEGSKTFTEQQIKVADTYKDTKITREDAEAILNYDVRNVNKLPILLPTYALLSVPTAIASQGEMVLYRFSAAAPVEDASAVKSFNFILSAFNAEVSNLKLYAYSDPAFSLGAYASNPVANENKTYTGVNNIATNITGDSLLIVPSGATRYFEVRATVSNVSSSFYIYINLEGLGQKLFNTKFGLADGNKNTASIIESIQNQIDAISRKIKELKR